MISFYTRYTLTTAQGDITEAGIREIETFLRSQRLQSELWKAANPTVTTDWLPALPDNWQWVWIVAHGEYAGTIPKRIAKYFYKVHGLNTPQPVLVELGNIARRNSSEQQTFIFEFANQIDWQDGDFGDSGSCWWGSYSGSRVMWNTNNGFAIRFFKESGAGYARAWLMEVDENLFTVMNGYGLTTLQITRIFSQHIGLTYKKIRLTNETSSSLYINGNSGYIVGTLEVISTIEAWDLGLEGEDAYTCSRCGRLIGEHDNFTGADDETYCEDCYYYLFSSCEDCGETFFTEDMNYIESIGYDVCNWCLENNYDHCDKCGDYTRIRRLQAVGERHYCRECLDDLNIEGQNIE